MTSEPTYAIKIVLTWAIVLLPTWLYLPLWFIVPHTFGGGISIGFMGSGYLILQAVALLFAKQSKYI